MKKLLLTLCLLPLLCVAQVENDSVTEVQTPKIIVEGDSIPKEFIDLDEVMLLHKLKFDSKKDRRRYLILRRKTIKVYPYAKLASERLQTMNERLKTVEKKRLRKRYIKRVQKYIEEKFAEKLKNFTRTEGQILVKLIHRQTGITAFDLIKDMRSGWKAFWYNTTASLFEISLKREFDPENEKEDYLIEDILQRNFQNGRLERQEPAIDIDFFELTEKWLGEE